MSEFHPADLPCTPSPPREGVEYNRLVYKSIYTCIWKAKKKHIQQDSISYACDHIRYLNECSRKQLFGIYQFCCELGVGETERGSRPLAMSLTWLAS